VSAADAQSMAQELDVAHCETSAKTGTNTDKAFISIIEQIYQSSSLDCIQKKLHSQIQHLQSCEFHNCNQLTFNICYACLSCAVCYAANFTEAQLNKQTSQQQQMGQQQTSQVQLNAQNSHQQTKSGCCS
jgi:Fe2+ transport system protein B